MKNNFKPFIGFLILFVLTHVLGLWVAYTILGTPTAVIPDPVSDYTLIDIAILLALMTLFIVIVTKFKRVGGWFFKVTLAFLILGGAQTVLDLFVSSEIAFFIGIFCVILFLFFNNIFLQNIIMIFTMAGIGALLGLSLTPKIVVIVLAVLSFYDIWAVYKTRHMVSMARTMISSGAISGFVIPANGQSLKSKINDFQPGEGFMLLGSGDVVLPLLLSVSLLSVSFYQAIVVSIFATVGLFIMYWLLITQDEPRPMAALPPIAMATLIGYIVTLL